jgi:hypothetical protein
MLLEHKKAVIYGAAGAIGGAVARSFAHEGADLVLAGRIRARVESVAEEISAAGGVAEAAEIDALDEDAIEKHMDDVVARAQRIDVLFNAVGMDDVQGTLLVDMSAEDFAQPVIKATRTSSSPCARRRGGWSGKGPGWSCPSPWLPRPCPTTGVRGRVRRGRRAVAEFRRGARTTRDPARHPAVGRVAGRARRQADLRASRPGRRDLPRSSWPRRAAGPCFGVFRCCPRSPRQPS